ncbi:hypothetical protein CKM354_001123000 [Cercospora kikuchii]|uniref:Uncharacterized protein n=1 Tax=Cercospora kikuchii TaxID=84275 RepID=A0A9P3CV64_9PEZI|nr:uncharacterized protein CKM354_001123000 [Cercospora kikuchii]GIZ48157.1 hypothetical protein CKM354_001123000 [Cercospora kikuchii]
MPLNEPDWIASDPSNHFIFNRLVTFLDETAASPERIEELVVDASIELSSAGTQQPTVDQYRTESRYLFAILLVVVQQLDPDAVQQDHLIRLVLKLRDSPVPTSVTQTIDQHDLDSEDMNRNLDNFIHVWGAFEFDAPLHPRLHDRPKNIDFETDRPPWRQQRGQYLSATSWANLNAFMAKLHTAAPDVEQLDLWGLFAMIEALEQPLSPAELEDAAPPAAYWIIYAGEELKQNDFPYAYYDNGPGTNRLPWSKGVLWDGQHAFNPARWEFWLQRFKAIAERPENSEEVRDVARRAFDFGSSLE